MTEIWTPTQMEFDAFARLSGDANPIHLVGAGGRFGGPVAHGMLIQARLLAMVARLCGGRRPARIALTFPAPAYADEPLTLHAEPTASDCYAVRAARTACGTPVAEGEVRLA